MDNKPEKISFSKNWNHKLDCEYFTTFRLFNPEKYFEGRSVEIHENGVLKKTAVIQSVRVLYLSQINGWMTAIDAGCGVEYFEKIIKTMYKNKVSDFTTQKFHFLLLRTLQ
ncbi:hypothetical protein SAMN04515674_101450 [Pseudarcicella hirudinis]|uniref:ASCH domain-containing protein n=1 Tax=Pseudarcicella hirudinis TaxID=1079859 RepID=A0A1I5MUA0_9BACT|nr:hypothetical protein [Pseudarcicella hirudinis]SFP13088.1 hypothetical protein SAMN04515674_101450 [Pseudarcicella hirudinis]